MNDGWLKSVNEEGSWSDNIYWQKIANLMFGIINRGVLYTSAEVISKLYRSYVCPHLEYCIQFWSPINEKDVDMLERV